MNVLDFLTRLDTNLTTSMNGFDAINKKINKDNLNILSELIKKNNINLYIYLDALKQLEIQNFTDLHIDIQETKPFVFSFDIDSNLYNKNFKNKFKQENEIDINIHKLQNNSINCENIKGIKTVHVLDNKNISPNVMNLPIIKDLKLLPPMMYWYEGDKFNKKGIYTCLTKGLQCRIPFPNMLSTNDQNFKINSIPCKYQTRENCAAYKLRISTMYESTVRECNYVHKTENFVKIGSFYRCNRESFGNYDTLNEDLGFIITSDIKRILMHALSDSLLSVLWYQNKFKDGNLMLNNLETF